MKNSQKHNGFGVIEVIISMALIGLLSIGVYNAYLMIVKQTKAGAIKQSVALHGKDTLEHIINAIGSDDIIYSNNGSNSQLKFNNIVTLYGIKDNTDSFEAIRYLDEEYKPCIESEGKYTEIIKLKKVKADLGEEGYENINLDKNASVNLNNDGNELWVSKEEKNYYLNDEKIEIESDKLILNIYIELKNIKVKDVKGNEVYNDMANLDNEKINIIINFSNYNQTEDSNINDVKINIYNRNQDVANIYIDKPINLKVNTVVQKGEINLYDNRGSVHNNKCGFLYDITLTVTDKNNSDNILFTANSKQNIDIK